MTLTFREFIIKAWIVYCFLVFLSTELLSIFNLINRTNLVLVYILLGLLILFLVNKKKISVPKYCLKNCNYWRWYLLLFVVILLPLLLIALYYPPNNYDSMTYHLPRVEHWIQNKNVEFYPTNNDRQLFSSPMAEYIILHWRLLVNNDTFVNMVQYFSMILSVLLSTLIVRKLKGGSFAAVMSVFLVATIPMGIAQATSTQNDYVTAFFTLAFMYFCMENNLLFISLSAALGFFTKSTFAIFALPIGVYWLYGQFKKDGLKVYKKIVFIVLIALVVNFRQFQRNYEYFGSIFGPKYMSVAMFNESFAPKYVISNMVRNIGSQVGLPNSKYNHIIDRIVTLIHNALNIKTNDSKNTWYSQPYTTFFSTHEDLAGSYLLFILFFISGFIAITKRYTVAKYYILSFIGWLLFNILLKWQPWISRLELPFWVIICPIVAIVIDKFIISKLLKKIVLIGLLIFSMPFVYGFISNYLKSTYITNSRPFNRKVLLFSDSRYSRFLSENYINNSYGEAVKKIKELNVKEIGLDVGSNSWEYPLWVALQHEDLTVNVSYITQPRGNSLKKNHTFSRKYDVIIRDNVADDSMVSKIDDGVYRYGYIEMLIQPVL